MGEIVPKVVGFSVNEIISKEVNDVVIQSCFLKNTGKKTMI